MNIYQPNISLPPLKKDAPGFIQEHLFLDLFLLVYNLSINNYIVVISPLKIIGVLH